MSASVTWTGLDELKAQLRALPEELANEASIIAQEHAQTAAAAVRAVYEQHRVTGYLADHVVVEVNAFGRFGVSVAVWNKSPHAWWFDNGTQARHFNGAARGAMWGKTPPTHVFVKTMIRYRRAMYEQLKAMLTRQGLQVNGDA